MKYIHNKGVITINESRTFAQAAATAVAVRVLDFPLLDMLPRKVRAENCTYRR